MCVCIVSPDVSWTQNEFAKGQQTKLSNQCNLTELNSTRNFKMLVQTNQRVSCDPHEGRINCSTFNDLYLINWQPVVYDVTIKHCRCKMGCN